MIGGPEEMMPMPMVAKLFNVSTDTIKRWMDELGFPRGFMIGSKRFFRAFEVKAWQEQQQKNQAPEPDEVAKKPKK